MDTIWFTDPPYGIQADYEGSKQEAALPAHVYRLDPGRGAGLPASLVTGSCWRSLACASFTTGSPTLRGRRGGSIAMGCAGLATATIANVLQAVDVCWLAALRTPPEVAVAVIFALTAMAVMFALALVLLIPIVILSVDFLCRRCRFVNHASWPPTFSTAVFAMGGLGLGTILNSDSVITLGRTAGWVTLTPASTSSPQGSP